MSEEEYQNLQMLSAHKLENKSKKIPCPIINMIFMSIISIGIFFSVINLIQTTNSLISCYKLNQEIERKL
ncbi:MAG: hypothetical protein PHE89_02790 [Alphaproteobacteria bacterium]|nr:hypothetical protein [Alphaproteobacteria bacterium]